jgi:hypothetical protein
MGAAHLCAAADSVVEREYHRVSAIGVGAAIMELALIGECGGALGVGG